VDILVRILRSLMDSSNPSEERSSIEAMWRRGEQDSL
jgi:hypothetical protein